MSREGLGEDGLASEGCVALAPSSEIASAGNIVASARQVLNQQVDEVAASRVTRGLSMADARLASVSVANGGTLAGRMQEADDG
jgi:hypothetical protein